MRQALSLSSDPRDLSVHMRTQNLGPKEGSPSSLAPQQPGRFRAGVAGTCERTGHIQDRGDGLRTSHGPNWDDLSIRIIKRNQQLQTVIDY